MNSGTSRVITSARNPSTATNTSATAPPRRNPRWTRNRTGVSIASASISATRIHETITHANLRIPMIASIARTLSPIVQTVIGETCERFRRPSIVQKMDRPLPRGPASLSGFSQSSRAGTHSEVKRAGGFGYNAPVRRKLMILIAVAGVVIALDQVTKWMVVDELTTRFDDRATFGEKLKAMYGEPPPLGYDGMHFRSKRAITVSENFFRLRYAENPGAAFGMFRNLPPPVRGPMFHLVSILAVILISFYYSKLDPTDREQRWALWGLPLVLGGAVGNYIDRLARAFVVDFLEAHWMDKAYWPSFNIADSAICIGVGMLVLDALLRKERKPVEAKP